MKNNIMTKETEFDMKVKLLPPFEDCALIIDKAGRRIGEEHAIEYIDKRLKELKK